ncbi:hypothetical protein [Hymenobacter sp. YC55]|uniref:hypothetical protein n=1 Tax=Hymenobacter sp. YC55 TaxID=3034019 RepID=UPI0023F67081|nr:hypothetical protein [Hymenobacter sp. YC55]MDF7810638.1 hypothetical protein [Hymenobacter sp. YC55]
MKTQVITVLLAFGFSTLGLAQSTGNVAQVPAGSARSTPFAINTSALNVGLGAGLNYSGFGYKYTALPNVNTLPAISLSYEKGKFAGVGPGIISIGGLLGYKRYSWQSGGYEGAWRGLILAVRSAYHYDLFHNPKLDTYAGLSLGVRQEKYRYENTDNTGYSSYARSNTALQSGVFLGARYFFSDKVGAFTELGYDASYLKLGLTMRL